MLLPIIKAALTYLKGIVYTKINIKLNVLILVLKVNKSC